MFYGLLTGATSKDVLDKVTSPEVLGFLKDVSPTNLLIVATIIGFIMWLVYKDRGRMQAQLENTGKTLEKTTEGINKLVTGIEVIKNTGDERDKKYVEMIQRNTDGTVNGMEKIESKMHEDHNNIVDKLLDLKTEVLKEKICK